MRGLNGNALKILAALTMLTDHVGAVFFPEIVFLRAVGRLAFPLFLYLLVEGACHTKNWKKYGMRLLILAAASEYFYDWMTLLAGMWNPAEEWHAGMLNFCIQNTVWELLLALFAVEAAIWSEAGKRPLLGAAVMAAACAASWALRLDYGPYGILLAYFWYLTRGNKIIQVLGLALISILGMGGLESFAAAAALPLLAYNGEKGKNSKWIQRGFYLFYPLHMGAICLAASFMEIF